MKFFLKLFFLHFFIVSLAFAGGNKEEASTEMNTLKKDTIIVAVQKLPISAIDAMAENSNVALRINFSVEETLIMTDYYDNYKLKPGLAESWELKDDTTLIFKLRKGVKFHNGEEMTAEDVAFTFGTERLMGEDAPGKAETSPFLYNLESVTAIDKYTVEVKSKEKDALFIIRFANHPTQIISKKAYIEAGSFEEFGRVPVGTGPYRIVRFIDDLEVVLERFDDYWGERKGAVENVVFKYVPEFSTRIAGIRTGEFDIITEVAPDQVEAIGRMDGVRVAGGAIRNIYGMFFDETNNTPMQDPRIREALTLAIDRKLLVSTLFSNLTSIPNNWQMKLFGDMYLNDYKGVAFDTERAKKLMEEAGYNGERIEYRSLPGYYTLEQTVAEAVTQMWQEVGFNVDLQIKENWSQIAEDDENRHIINGSFTAYYPDPVGQFWRRFGANGGKAQGLYFTNSKEFNELGAILETSSDLKTRRETFRKMMDIFNHDPNGLYLYNLPMIYCVRDEVDWSPLPIEGMDFTIMGLKSY